MSMMRGIILLMLALTTLPAGVSKAFPAMTPPSCDLYIPNAFSPNDDGRNDLFRPQTNCPLLEYELHIYNRWGAQVFTSRAPDRGWDGEHNGRDQPQGVYMYVIRYSVGAGELTEEAVETGEVVLLR